MDQPTPPLCAPQLRDQPADVPPDDAGGDCQTNSAFTNGAVPTSQTSNSRWASSRPRKVDVRESLAPRFQFTWRRVAGHAHCALLATAADSRRPRT